MLDSNSTTLNGLNEKQKASILIEANGVSAVAETRCLNEFSMTRRVGCLNEFSMTRK
jgi:hypothetical protein